MSKRIEMPHCKDCNIRCTSLFSHLTGEEMGMLDYQKDSFSIGKGHLVFQEGNHPKGVYIIYSGKIKVYKLGSNAKEQIVRLATTGDILGYRSLMGGDRYFASAAAIEDSTICFIPRDLVFNFLESNAELSIKLMKLLSQDLAKAEKKMVEMVQKPVRDRLAEALLILKDLYGLEDDGKTLKIVMTREDIANFVGTTPETAIRILSEFREEKLISLVKKRIIIEDMPRMVRESHIND